MDFSIYNCYILKCIRVILKKVLHFELKSFNFLLMFFSLMDRFAATFLTSFCGQTLKDEVN